METDRVSSARALRGRRPAQDRLLAPRGLIRFTVLRLLFDEPMSGSEVVSEIEARTRGVWRPSPGSIYPLLEWMVRRGYIRMREARAGLKRYELTDYGREALREQTETLLGRLPWVDLLLSFSPAFVEGQQEVAELWEGLRHVLAQVNDLVDRLRATQDGAAAAAARSELEALAMRLRELATRLDAAVSR
ncbi:MAG: PadR family transcriptional regulator [Armatimonadota bacterium]|nr:PadR family transcriptional regulator [Armatimonadota bacterium]